MSSLNDRDAKGNYIGPRGEQYLKVFICYGCQSCLRMNDKDEVIDTGPHFLSQPTIVEGAVSVAPPNDTAPRHFDPFSLEDWEPTSRKHVWFSPSTKIWVFCDETEQFDTTPYYSLESATEALEDYIRRL